MYSAASKVDIGAFENQNDDRALVGNKLLDDKIYCTKSAENYLIAAICDGVGGLSYGYKAAETTLRFMSYLNRPSVEASTIRSAIEEANRRVIDVQTKDDCCSGMRTTITGAYLFDNSAIVFNVGDSRTYRFRYKYLMQLSKDDSLVQDMIEIGEITEEQSINHPQRNIINKCIGNTGEIEPKIVEWIDDFCEEDILFMCSDGISDVLSTVEMQEIISKHKDDDDLSNCCVELCKKAENNGSKDNMSVILVRKDKEDD